MSGLRQRLRTIRDVVTSPVGSVLGVRTRQPLLGLTFDDGPDPEQTPRLLDVLDQAGARATFFMLVNRARQHPELVREVVRRGHEVGLHGLDHRRLTNDSTERALREVAAGREELAGLVQRSIAYFRPPYGAQTLPIWRGVRRLGLEVIFWGPSLWDWKDASAEARAERAMSGVGPGSIVLGHDGLAGRADGADADPFTGIDRPAWAAEMIGRYAELGLQGVGITQLLASGRPVRGARFGE